MKICQSSVSRSDLVISDGEADYPLARRLDCLLILDAAAAGVSTHLLDSRSLVLFDAEKVPTPPEGPFRTLALPFTETARDLGNTRVTNVVALGALAAIGKVCDPAALEQALLTMTPRKLERLNREAFEAGCTMAETEPA